MISRLPSWVWGGAGVLAFIAGIVNVIGLLGFQHQAVAHLTGNTSLLAAALVHHDSSAATQLAALMGSFLLGTSISGFMIQDGTLQLGRPYSAALLMVAALLFAAAPLLEHHQAIGMYCAACACGLQNAMVSTYSGAVVRTTHVSGMFTDLGIAFGHALRGLPVDTRRLRLCVAVITGFTSGGLVGAWLFGLAANAALTLPATMSALLAAAHAAHARHNRCD